MKAYKIDVVEKCIKEVDIPDGIDAIYQQLECDLFTCPLVYANNDTVYVDDEALLNEVETQYGGFRLKSFPSQALFGHGLIIGTNEHGESQDVQSKLSTIEDEVTFLSGDELLAEFNRLRDKGFDIYVY